VFSHEDTDMKRFVLILTAGAIVLFFWDRTASADSSGERTSPNRTEVAIEKNAPDVHGHPLTSVVVTQCNLVVAVYMTMPDGKLLRFDSTAAVSAQSLVEMAYTATRSERVEVSCNETGTVGYETHSPI
jgi:hypothetical protein